MIRAVTFDAVGTLIATAAPVGEIYAQVAVQHGVLADPGAVDAAFPVAFRVVKSRWTVPYGADDADARRFWTEVIASAFAQAGAPLGADTARIADACYDTFTHPRSWRILPGVRAALALVAARGLPMAVISNFDGRLAPLLRAMELGPFAAVITSAEIGAAKPDPLPLRAAAARLGMPPDAILHVGDSPSEDGGMCSAAGCGLLLVDPAVGVEPVMLAARLEAEHR